MADALEAMIRDMKHCIRERGVMLGVMLPGGMSQNLDIPHNSLGFSTSFTTTATTSFTTTGQYGPSDPRNRMGSNSYKTHENP
jgi:hypothetical protein